MKVKNKSPWDGAPPKVLNSNGEEKIVSKFEVVANGIKDKGDGLIMFGKPAILTDTSEQWNGTKYDVPTLDMTGWNLLMTADHIDKVVQIVGKVVGLKKVANKRVQIDGIQFATKNALGALSYDLMRDPAGPFLTDFSIETVGPWPDDDGVYMNSKLVGCSVVVAGNNKNAHINEIATNTIKEAEENGVDATAIKELFKLPIDSQKNKSNNDDMLYVTIKNARTFAIEVTYKNAAGEQTKTTLKANQTVDVPEDQGKDVQGQVDGAEEPKDDTKADDAADKGDAKDDTKDDAADDKADNAVLKAINALTAKVDKIEKETFDNGVKEPQFTRKIDVKTSNKLAEYSYKQRHGMQVLNAWDWLKSGNTDAHGKLNELNKFHLEELQKKGKVENSVTIGDFGNFVISPELLSEIEGFRSNFTGLISRLNYQETLSLQMAWLNRNGDINMQEVEMCDDGADGNLKPISEYTATIQTSNLHELAAVTPVCNAATRFLAADLLTDVAAGYRNDFDRKRAQLFIARCQQAVNSTGNTNHYATTSDVNALKSFFTVAAAMQQDVMNGVYILSQKSFWELQSRFAGAGINTDSGFNIFSKGENGPLLLGSPYIIVPNELLPTLNTAETRSFTVEGVSVSITQAVFYVDLSTFSGRTSGGLNYDLSTEAAYEDGENVKSAFQRNELVLRGSFFRGGAIRNLNKVVGLGDAGFS